MPTSRDAVWQQKLAALRAHVAAHGRLPPHGDASGLGVWINTQRQAKKAADAGRKCRIKMTQERAAALEGVPGWAWEVNLEALWQEKLNALRAYVGAHGRLPVPGDPSGLGGWINWQRLSKRATDAGRKSNTKMSPQRVAALEAVPGWAWDAHGAAWEENLAALRAFVAAHGHLPLTTHPSGLGSWVHSQREAKKAADARRGGQGRMTATRAAKLEAVPGWTWRGRRSNRPHDMTAAPPAKRAKRSGR